MKLINIPLLTLVSMDGNSAKRRLDYLAGNFWEELEPTVLLDNIKTFHRDWKIAKDWLEVVNRLRHNPHVLLTVEIGIAPVDDEADAALWPVVEAKDLKRMLEVLDRYQPSKPERAYEKAVNDILASAIGFVDLQIKRFSKVDGILTFIYSVFGKVFVPKVVKVKASIRIEMLLLDK